MADADGEMQELFEKITLLDPDDQQLEKKLLAATEGLSGCDSLGEISAREKVLALLVAREEWYLRMHDAGDSEDPLLLPALEGRLGVCFLEYDSRDSENTYSFAGESPDPIDEEIGRRNLEGIRRSSESSISDWQVSERVGQVMTRMPPPRLQNGWSRMISPADGRGSKKAPDRTDDFRELREYSTNDDIRRVDWNAFARTEKLYVREFNQASTAEARNISLLVDAESILSSFESPSTAIDQIYRFVSSARSRGKNVEMQVHFRGNLIYKMSSEDLRADFQSSRGPQLGRATVKSPGEDLYGALWRIGKDVSEYLDRMEDGVKVPSTSLLRNSPPLDNASSGRKEAPGMVVLAVTPYNRGPSIEQLKRTDREVQLLDV
jgi:hypothetical protein